MTNNIILSSITCDRVRLICDFRDSENYNAGIDLYFYITETDYYI